MLKMSGGRVKPWMALLSGAFLVPGCLAAIVALGSEQQSFVNRPVLQGFISEMVAKHNFERSELQNLFREAVPQPDILRALAPSGTISKPRPWYQYRAGFLNPTRINAGLRFWDDNAEALQRARAVYGVPPEAVVGIIGVETAYGKNTGYYRVLDALSTLAFDFPRRAEFFRGELEQFLLLVRDEGLDGAAVRGSYAGAMGIPQFIPSSFRRYSVDFDSDGRRDIWNSSADAIGSIANYFSHFGWQPDQPVALRADVTGDPQALIDEGIKPVRRLSELREMGVVPRENVPGDPKAALAVLETEAGREYWLMFNNFYVITRYNRSINYAMAVFHLGREIRRLRESQVSRL